MNLQHAIDAFEASFASVRDDENLMGAIVVFSGGVGENDKPPPCLCATEELAAELWLEAARLACSVKPNVVSLNPLIWKTRPRILKYQMTMAEVRGTQRLVTDRYAVYSELAFTQGELPREPGKKPTKSRAGRP